MCGRYALYQADHIDRRFGLAEPPSFGIKDNYNAAPGQALPVVYQAVHGRLAELMQWGFVPFWSKDPKKGLRPINTKSEAAFQSRMWREATQHRRCLVPARGFYEWKRANNGARAGDKEPYFVHPKDQDLFGFACIYSVWSDSEGRPLPTFSIMTTRPNKELESIHNRMPVILLPEQERLWLDPTLDQEEPLAELLKPYPNNGLEMYRVSKDVNSPTNNDRHLIQPIATK